MAENKARQVVLPDSVHRDTGVMHRWAEGRKPWNVGITKRPALVRNYVGSRADNHGRICYAPTPVWLSVRG